MRYEQDIQKAIDNAPPNGGVIVVLPTSKICPVCQEEFGPKPDDTPEQWEHRTFCSRTCWRGGK